MSFSAKLAPAAITWLGSAFENKTPLSPFTTIQVPGFTEEDKKALMDQKVIDTTSAFTPEAYAVLSELASAKSFGSVRLNGSFGLIDKVVYFGDTFPVTVDNAGDSLVISTGQSREGFDEILDEITGNSRLTNAVFEIEMGEKAALTLSSLLDLSRKSGLTAYAQNVEIREAFSDSEILEFFNTAEGSRWITGFLKRMPLENGTLSASDVEESLKSLESANCIQRKDGTVRLIGDAATLAMNLLVIDQTVVCRVAQEHQGQTVVSDALILQAGLHDLLMIDSGADGIGFSALSTRTLRQFITKIISEPPQLI